MTLRRNSTLISYFILPFLCILFVTSALYSADFQSTSNHDGRNNKKAYNPFDSPPPSKKKPSSSGPRKPRPKKKPRSKPKSVERSIAEFEADLADDGYRPPYITIPEGTNIEVLVLGQTGSGKSTFLNMAANYFQYGTFGVKKNQRDIKVIIPTRYLKPTDKSTEHSETDVHNQAKSQTSKPTAYQFVSTGRSITFIDTPGMADTEGIERDERNLSDILKDASKRGKLAGLILVFNGAEPRDTATRVYALKKLMGAIPDVALENTIAVLTNTSAATCSFPIARLEEIGITLDRIFYMNNSVLASNPRSWANRNTARQLKIEWDNSMITLSDIAEKLAANSQKISREFRRMWKLRNRVMHEFHKVRLKFVEIQEAQQAIALYSARLEEKSTEADAFKDFAQKATVTTRKFVEKPRRHYSTICSTHNVTCHDECGLDETYKIGDRVLTGCTAFDGSNGKKCRVCQPGPCGYEMHYHARGVFVEVTETLQDRLEHFKKQYNDASSAALTAKVELDSAESALKQLKAAVDQFASDVRETLIALKAICKGYNIVAELNSTIALLEQESTLYTSMEAAESARTFIGALRLMAQELTEQGFDTGSTDDGRFGNSVSDVTDFDLLKGSGVISKLKGGFGKFLRL